MFQQLPIGIGNAPNDGTGTPIRTAFSYVNQNFQNLFLLVNTSPPASNLKGKTGDVSGMYAYDANYFYYCFNNYDGVNVIWSRIPQINNITLSNIHSGTSTVSVDYNGNVTINASGTSNVVTVGAQGIYARGTVSVLGNVTANTIYATDLSGTLSTASQPNVTSLGVLSNLTISGLSSLNTVTVNSITSYGNITAIGNVSGHYFVGNGSQLTGVTASGVGAGAITGDTLSATVLNSNLTSVGTLANLSVNGNINAGLFNGNGAGLTHVSATGAPASGITGNTLALNVVSSSLTTVGTLGNLTVNGNITGGHFYGDGSHLTGVIANGVSAGGLSGTVLPVSIVDSSLTTVGTLANLTVTGNVTGNYFIGNGSQLTGLSIPPTYTNANVDAYLPIYTGNVNGGNIKAINTVYANLFVGTFQGNITGNMVVAGLNTQVLYNNAGNAGADLGFTYNSTSQTVTLGNALIASGNISGNYILGNGSQLTGISTSGLTSRVSVAVSTGTITANTSASVVATGFKGYALYSINTSDGAWVTLYTSNAVASLDQSRSMSTDPTPGSGVLAEAITTTSTTVNFTPAVYGYNNETIPTTAIPMKIYNNSNYTANITVTLTLLKLEN